MALVIKEVVDLTSAPDSQNIPPKYVNQLKVVQEPDDRTYQYFVVSDKAKDKRAAASALDFGDLLFVHLASSITQSSIKKLCVGHFPQVGAIAAYSYKYEERSRILAPVHPKQPVKGTAPTLTVEVAENSVKFVVTPPEDITYNAYRIIMRLNYKAYEYITYNHELIVDTPVESGNYEVYCMGYVGEGQKWSEDSVHQEVSIVGNPYHADPVHDLYAKGVDINAAGYIEIAMSDGTTLTSKNKIETTQVVYVSNATVDSMDNIVMMFTDGKQTNTHLQIPPDVTIVDYELDANNMVVAIDNNGNRYTHDTSEHGTTPPNLCDGVPYNAWVAGTSIYPDNNNRDLAFVIPVEAGKSYKIKSLAVGDIETIVLTDVDPRTQTSGWFYATRNVYTSSSPVVGKEHTIKAATGETYLMIFYTEQGATNVSYEVTCLDDAGAAYLTASVVSWSSEGFIVVTLSDGSQHVGSIYKPVNVHLPYGAPDRISFTNDLKLQMVLTSGDIVLSTNTYQAGGSGTATDPTEINSMLDELNGEVIT